MRDEKEKTPRNLQEVGNLQFVHFFYSSAPKISPIPCSEILVNRTTMLYVPVPH
jgi:hypothetical protein